MPGSFKQFAQTGNIPLTDQIARDVEATYTVPARIRSVRAATTAAGSAFTITLGPPEAEPFLTKMIYMTARNGSKDITVSNAQGGDITLDAADEYTLVVSDGEIWVEIGSNHA